MKTSDIRVGDRIKIRNSVSGTVIEITSNGWIKVVWTFVNRGNLIGFPKRDTQIDSFRARDVEKIIHRED